MKEGAGILIVEGDPRTRAASARLLRGDGHEVLEAESGAEAWRLLREFRPGLVLLDVVLPDVDGRVLCSKIKNDPELAEVSVVLVSAIKTDSDEQAKGLEEGADGYIVRPVPDREFLARVRAMLRIRAAQARVRALATQQAAVAELSHWALSRGSRESLLERAARSIFDTLMVSVVCIQTVKAAGGQQVIRIPEDIPAGSARCKSIEQGCALLAKRVGRSTDPVPLEELAQGGDGAALRFISGQGFRGGLGLPLQSRGGRLGALLVLDGSRKDFEPHEVHFLQSVVNVLTACFERFKGEEDLKESRDRFRQLAENLGGVFWLRDVRKKQTVYLSPQYEQLFGRNPALLAKDVQDFLMAVHPEDRERVENAFERQDQGEQTRIDYRVLLPGGGVRWVRARSVTIPDGSGKVWRVAGFAEDVTVQREMERELVQAKKFEASALMAGGVAHDFSNLLGVILGCLSLAKLNVPPEEIGGPLYRFISDAESVAMRAAELTRQFVMFASGGVLNRKLLQPWELVSTAAGALPVDASAYLETFINDACWSIEADTDQVNQMLTGIITNAMEAMPQGGTISFRMENVTLGVEAAENLRVEPGNYLRISISDQGRGISPERIEKIFDPYYSTKDKGTAKGMGLGLTLARSIAEKHGGCIQVESREEAGATFHIYLPAATADPRGDAPGDPLD